MVGIDERLLGLVALGDDCFEAAPVHTAQGDAYGGEVLARALWAMTKTVAPGRLPHAVHASYLRPAQNGEATEVVVVRERDGRAFSTRRAVARQRGKDMVLLTAGFHDAPAPDAVARFQRTAMPDVPPPESLEAARGGHLLLDLRVVDRGEAGMTRVWARAADPLPEDPAVHACLLAYVSDYSNGLFTTPLGGLDVITLDHALWFHRPASLADWVLMDLEPVAVAVGRGTYQGTIYDRGGEVVATFVQAMFGMARNHPTYG